MKNRDARRAKARIFTSGAAGCGKSGPPPPDKRNLEFPCPQCDRIFKQVFALSLIQHSFIVLVWTTQRAHHKTSSRNANHTTSTNGV